MSTHETNFTLKPSAKINQDKALTLDDFTINGTAKDSQFFLLLKNYGTANSSIQAEQIYSVFASSNGGGQITSISPTSFVKENHQALSGDYLLE